MFLRLYRKKIAEEVETKMCYMGSCPNEMEIILSIISPKDYPRTGAPSHCSTDCWNTTCESYRVEKESHEQEPKEAEWRKAYRPYDCGNDSHYEYGYKCSYCGVFVTNRKLHCPVCKKQMKV